MINKSYHWCQVFSGNGLVFGISTFSNSSILVERGANVHLGFGLGLGVGEDEDLIASLAAGLSLRLGMGVGMSVEIDALWNYFVAIV